MFQHFYFGLVIKLNTISICSTKEIHCCGRDCWEVWLFNKHNLSNIYGYWLEICEYF